MKPSDGIQYRTKFKTGNKAGQWSPWTECKHFGCEWVIEALNTAGGEVHRVLWRRKCDGAIYEYRKAS